LAVVVSGKKRAIERETKMQISRITAGFGGIAAVTIILVAIQITFTGAIGIA
jgi:hypothetical protein